MAALRVAARRLAGGGGQTPAVAVGEAQRRIFPRLFQVNRARSAASSAATGNSNAAAGKGLDVDCQERILKEIHYRREQLYDLTAEAENKYDLSGKTRRQVAWLRQQLAAQVEPRSKDRMWRVLRGKSMFEYYGGIGALVFTCCYVLPGMAMGSIVELGPEEREWIKKKRSEASKRKPGNNVSLK